jgi:hypothetical protein
MRGLLVVLAITCLLPGLADAGDFSMQGGGNRTWVKTIEGGSWEPVTAPMAGFSYDVPMGGVTADGELSMGMSFAFRATEDVDTDMIEEYSAEFWNVRDYFEWFAGAQLIVWNDVLVDETAGGGKLLGGGRVGIRFEAEGIPLEVSTNWSGGPNGKGQFGVFFGPRLTTSFGGG